MHLEQLECLLDQVAEVISLTLAVINFIPHVQVFSFKEVHDREDLSVVGHKSFSDGVGAGYEGLQDLKSDCDDFGVTGVQGGLNRNNQLRNNGQNLRATFFEHVEHTLDSEESVWVDFFHEFPRRRWASNDGNPIIKCLLSSLFYSRGRVRLSREDLLYRRKV